MAVAGDKWLVILNTRTLGQRPIMSNVPIMPADTAKVAGTAMVAGAAMMTEPVANGEAIGVHRASKRYR